MKIVCPECGFARELPEDKIPPTAQVATCPKCRHKFKFRELPQEQPIHFEDEPPTAPDSPRETPPPLYEDSDRQPEDAPLTPDDGEDDDIYYPEPDEQPAGQEAREIPTPEPEDPELHGQTGSGEGGKSDGDIWNRLESMGDFRPATSGRIRRAAGQSSERVTPPWENLQEHGFFGGLAKTVRLAMFKAPKFFSSMKVGSGIMKPMIFYLLLSEFYAIIQYMWDMLGLYSDQMGGGLDQQLGQMGSNPMGGLDSLGITPALTLLLYPAIFALMILLSSGLTHVFLTLFRAASSGFEGTFRAATYGSAPLVLAVIPVVGPGVSMVWSLVITIIGYKNVHQTTYPRVILALVTPLVLLFMLAVILVSTGIMVQV
ncbi:zinc-ribbon domain-containing protein [Oceanidesulfovibrio marinus]|uniref:Yip1 domain-containing protein n=1 Tax=Oceanidesulfovibrio marinus TaxID=370038 RepID=A0A6P1ZKS0_9BACT|nr:zinc-ribbon domain-containing protein [Oceanidesulfovibrio marinus]QJT11282.1 hypothetical protein E8L03_09595 [Oceanidesulfovibrio marinus]TVM36396.1 hypothetical protein DQK91_00285 [Oceanidesulfovibrio marinus]